MEEENYLFAKLAKEIHSAVEILEEHQKAFNAYDGYNWGYHGHYHAERRDGSIANLKEVFDAYIDCHIRRIMSEADESSH